MNVSLHNRRGVHRDHEQRHEHQNVVERGAVEKRGHEEHNRAADYKLDEMLHPASYQGIDI